MSIPRLAIHRPITMFMIAAVILLLGGVSLMRLPVDLMPDLSFPSITVRVNYTGVGPLEMEELVTRPVEQAVSAVAGLEQLNSTSSEGASIVRLNFTWGTDLDAAADDVRSRIDRIRGRLPLDAEPPMIFKFDATAFPIMGLAVEGDFDPVTLREIAERQLSPRLERAPGVAAVMVDGGLRREIHVELSRQKITALRLPVDRIVNLLRTENQNLPLGEIDEGDTSFLLRSHGQFTRLDDIRDLVVLTKDGVPVYVRDLANVVDTTEDRRSFLRVNGRPAVRMRVTKQSGGNTVQIADNIRAEVERINRSVPGIKLTPLFDQSVFIRRSIDNVQQAALFGSLLVVIVIFVFLRDLRATFIICSSIPISVVGTFALLHFAGYTLNTMTFGGLALGVGMIVDASIVVLENTYRHMQMGKDRASAAVEGGEEVWGAIVASTLTQIAVFLPLLFLTGVSNLMFKQLSVVVIFSLAMSLFVAVTIVPVLCAALLRQPAPAAQRRGVSRVLFGASERAFAAVDRSYRGILHAALFHRPTVLGAGAGLFVLALALMPQIGSELMPPTDEGEVTVTAELPVGTRIERTDAAMLQLEQIVRERVPEALTIVSSAGAGGGPGARTTTHRANIQLMLAPRAERRRSSEMIARDLRRDLNGLPGVIVRARPSGGNFLMNRFFGGGDSRLALEIRGYDLGDARRLSQDARTLMERTPGVADVEIGREEGRPELAVRVDAAKAALLGMSVTGVASTIRTNVAGTQAAFYRERGFEYPIVVRLREEDRRRIADVDDILLSTPDGQMLPARNVVAVSTETGPVEIERKNQQRLTRVNAEVETTLSDAVRAVEQQLPQLRPPQDFDVGFGAEVEEQARAFRQLQLMLILAVLLVYAVMASQYESLRDPFIIMFSVPLAAIGVVLMLLLTGTTFSLQAYIGVIMLAGIVVNNAILLVDYTNTLRRRDGMELREAVETAGRTRLRPILMTSLTTMLGLVPMSLGIGEGGELQAPLARVVIGGLLTSMLITLVFVPAMYTIFEEGLSGLRRGLHRKDSAVAAGS